MMKLIGYGEDALTYYVLTKRLDEILGQLRDASSPSACTIFYRPSFGRGGRSRALIGEFDAILITPQCMYLIESKWSSSNELGKGELASCQSLRHAMMRWIAEHWDGRQSFDDFCHIYQNEFREAFIGKELAPAGSSVSNRLFRVLTEAYERSTDGTIRTKNILMVFTERGEHIKPIIVPEGFTLIRLEYKPMNESGFFRM